MIKHASLFSQMIELINRKNFHQLVYRHQTERFAKTFNSWEHFVSMFFCQVAQAKSLREICGGLACWMGKNEASVHEKRAEQINPWADYWQ